MAATVISRQILGAVQLITASGTTPEGSVAAPVGSILLSESGLFYTKASGTGNTGWVTALPSDGVLSTVLAGISFASAADITAASTVLEAFGQLQAKFNASAPTFLTYSGGSQAFTSASLADVNSTTLTFPSTGFYMFEFAPLYDAALVGTGAGFSVDGTAVFDYMTCEVIYRVGSGDRAAHAITAYNTLIAAVASLSTTNNRALLRGIINVTTAGTILLRCATESAGSAITVTAVQAFIRKLH